MKTYISVFVTKSNQFRAQITVEGQPDKSYGVTVGGKEWQKGKGGEYRGQILTKCVNIIENLNHVITKELTDGKDK